MKKRNYMVRILAAAMAVSLIAGCGGTSGTPQSSASAGSAQPVADGGPAAGAPAETYTLRFATGHQETDPTFQEAVKWGESVKEKTGGAVVIECYADGVLGTPEDIHEQMRQGANLSFQADAGRVANYVPEFAAISAPYVLDGYDQLSVVDQLPCVQEWEQRLEDEFGLIVLAWNWTQGYRHVYANKQGVSPDGFKNVTLRSAEAPLWVETVKTLGATPIAIPYGEQYSAIQTKVVDGCEQSVGNAYNSQLYEVCKYMVETRHIFMGNCITVSAGWFRSLPEEYQRIVREECKAAGDVVTKNNEELDASRIQEMVDKGMELIPSEQLDIEAFKANAQPSYEVLGISDAISRLKEDLAARQ